MVLIFDVEESCPIMQIGGSMIALSIRLRLYGGPCRPLRFQEPLSIRKVDGSSSDVHHSSGGQHLSCHIHRPKLVPASSNEYHHFFRKPRKFLGGSSGYHRSRSAGWASSSGSPGRTPLW